MAWDVEFTDQFEEWWHTLTMDEQAAIDAAVEALEDRGPALGRPFVDTVKASRHQHTKELRPLGGNVRILFAFDRRRTGILLIGGDKTDRWDQWYRDMIPVADDLFDEHLEELEADQEHRR